MVLLGMREMEDSARSEELGSGSSECGSECGSGCGSGSASGVLGELELALSSEGLLEYRDPQASVPVLSIGYGFTDAELKALSQNPQSSRHYQVGPLLFFSSFFFFYFFR